MVKSPGPRSMQPPPAHPPAAAAVPAPGANCTTLSEYDALGLAQLIQRKELSPLELLEATITRAESAHAQFNFLSQRHYDYARAAINKGLSRGPFTGVPFLLKDLDCYIAGELTEQGSRYFKGQRASVTSELVHRYERAGLVVFGKTTVPELGLAATTESTATGLTRNPWNPQHIAGGSSGGSAVAVASGVVPAAHATDSGGSIRIPASCCGLFGLKPSRGRVPLGPPLTEGWGGMATHHALTRTVRDSAALLDATHGMEPGSRYCAPRPPFTFFESVQRSPGKRRIALNTAPPADTPVDRECVAAARSAAQLCQQLGHHVEEAAPRLNAEALGRAALTMIASSVVSDLRMREAATGIKPSLDVVEIVTLSYHEMGWKMTAEDLIRANNDLQDAALTIARFMQDFDVLLSPTLAAPPMPLGLVGLSPPDLHMYFKGAFEFAPFTALYNQTGQPSMSVPLAMSSAGLPIGVMFTARYGEETTLFSLAGQLERTAPWAHRHSPQRPLGSIRGC